jgi:hypothetical protein
VMKKVMTFVAELRVRLFCFLLPPRAGCLWPDLCPVHESHCANSRYRRTFSGRAERRWT